MSGVGNRFVQAGFKDLKPLIEIAGESIISHVLNAYPRISSPIFIISDSHPQKSNLIHELKRLRPEGKIVEIPAHKLGPSYAVWCARSEINPDLPTVVNYCDFAGIWNSDELGRQLAFSDGVIVTYSGFHPHMLRSTKFAYVKKSDDGQVLDIQEKNPFTSDPMQEEASSGTYGFKSGKLMIQCIEKQMAEEIALNGEFYTSLTYKPMLSMGLVVSTIQMKKFFQWGTPEDVVDWNYWHDAVTQLNCNPREIQSVEGSALVLAAGRGSRMANLQLPAKPRVKIGQSELWEFSGECAKASEFALVVTRDQIIDTDNNLKMQTLNLEELTEGQASTALLGLKEVPIKEKPITIFSCDNVVYAETFARATEMTRDYDLVVWTAPNYPASSQNPESYSWIHQKLSPGKMIVKKARPESFIDYAMVIGNFTFKSALLAEQLIQKLIESNTRINGEFYLDSVIELSANLGLKIGVIPTKSFFAIGTEQEYLSYKYWSDSLMEYEFEN
jgi:bifunctional N-acetylglucosamine-1-phosphate-uridyltransferase/glucosamine-1-phosphate-acetyltransferase GlmU-like protein